MRPYTYCSERRTDIAPYAGLLFTHWIADSLTLWKAPETQSDARLWTAATYYAILARIPPALLYLYAAVALTGGATLLWSLGDLRAGNLMFDGGSVCECYVCVGITPADGVRQCCTRPPQSCTSTPCSPVRPLPKHRAGADAPPQT